MEQFKTIGLSKGGLFSSMNWMTGLRDQEGNKVKMKQGQSTNALRTKMFKPDVCGQTNLLYLFSYTLSHLIFLILWRKHVLLLLYWLGNY